MPSEEIQFCSVTTDEGSVLVPYRIERSNRLKRMQLQVQSPDFVTLKLPPRQSVRTAVEFLRDNGTWVLEAIQKQPRPLGLRAFIARQKWVSGHGKKIPVEMTMKAGHFGFRLNSDKPRLVLVFDPKLDVERQFAAILKDCARHLLTPRVHEFAMRESFRVHGISIRNQKGRWGSCSETGALSLNWRLILLPPHLQDHVLLHELAHLRHFDHSAKFHQLLASLDPKAAIHARELDKLSPKLIPLGRPVL